MSIKGRKPTVKEQAYMDKVREFGCIVCYLTAGVRKNCEIHHIEGKTKPNCHFLVLGLCFEHHRAGRRFRPISRHPYKRRFTDAYGTEYDLLKKQNELLEQIDESDSYLPF
tara:strand:- start:2888 stop:3220 length:333 start_codon:yes stop_codon:yes gene_type:complete